MKATRKLRLKAWLDTLSAQGRYTFTKREALAALRVSSAALSLSLLRQAKAGVLAKPKSGFYLIVDPAHRSLGCLPPEWFIAELMAYEGLSYYVGGLSAAAIHGASHQAAQEMQVVVPSVRTAMRPVVCGKVRIRFMRSAGFAASCIRDHKTSAGFFKVSDAESTAWDLVYFNKSTGGLDHVAGILRDLSEGMDAKKLKQVIRAHGDELTARRLGYLLQFLKLKALAQACKTKKGAPIRLLESSGIVAKGHKLDTNWNLIINHSLDPDA